MKNQVPLLLGWKTWSISFQLQSIQIYNKNFSFPTNPVVDILCSVGMEAMIKFHAHSPLLEQFFSNEDYLCHEHRRQKPVLLRRWLFCGWRLHLWAPLRMEWYPSVSAAIFCNFSISDIRAPCHPINVTNLKRPLDIIHLFQNAREFILKRNHFIAVIVGISQQSAAIFCSGDITLHKEWNKGGETVRAHRWEWSR